MAEFDELRQQLRRARAQKDEADDSAVAAKERLKRIEAQQAALERVFDPENPTHAAERERLEDERARANESLKQSQDAQAEAGIFEGEIFENFAPLTDDPHEAIVRMNDDFPILLLPVRLETRFKSVTTPGDDVSRPQLWVRIYPDDCFIDTFEPTLSEAEIANAKLYWTGIWEAGGIEDQERGAWRGLVAGHGSGRAEWIISNYKPLSITQLTQQPTKALPDDVILTIPTETRLGDAEEKRTARFWREVWLADGDKTKEDAARAALDTAVGADRAEQIVAQYRPANIDKTPTAPRTKEQVNVSAAFVVFPNTEDLDIKQHSWARAPKVTMLPDRFVFLGYAGSGPPLVVVADNPVPSPLIVGPDPSAPEQEQLRQDEDGEIIVPDEMRWMVDFDRAVQVGLGFRIDLNETQATRGFDRVLVVGLRLSADEAAAKSELETLIEHHRFSRTGFSLVPQGTPTNNTETSGSGFDRSDDSDASFDDLREDALFEEEFDWLDKKDGQWLAEYLGIDSAVLKKIRHSDGRDQANARAMHVALWPATLGYWMETMMAPVFGPEAVEDTREFFNRFVIGRGAVPAVRLGRQPYGILPATALSRMRWMEPRDEEFEFSNQPGSRMLRYVRRLYSILRLIDADWQDMAAEVSFAGKPGDAHETLLDIVGLHSGSVEFSQRYAESAQQLYNRLNLGGLGGLMTSTLLAALQRSGTALLAELGYTGNDVPDILNKFFFGKHNLLKGPLIDDKPLSETEPIRAYTADGNNYLQWLIDAANTSLDAVYAQEGFLDDKPPQALLYLMLRHAIQLGYHDVSVRLHESVGLLDAEAATLARRDEPFIHIREQAQTSESRYQLLYKPEPAITGSATMLVGEFIGSSVSTLPLARYLNEQVQALVRLNKDHSTALLERAFTEHIDCCTYRLDAWLLGLVHLQLAAMRNLRDRDDAQPTKGIYLGAYAWLEEVRPENRVLTPVRLEDPDLIEAFTSNDEPPLQRDSANQGYVHAPSLNQAVAAAVLRSGYVSNASSANRQTMAVNLTSERVRTALGMLEGIRGGQSLGALLGYQFERGLHDRHTLAEVDEFIFDLRREFPLVSNRLASTRVPEDGPIEAENGSIEALEARNVIDGLALVDHIKSTGHNTYPFGKTTLPSATTAEAAAINAEVARLLETHDAVADLALAEGVYQAVLGNYDRVASTYDAYSKGNVPPEPQVVGTPTSGIGLTHRVGLHLEAGIDPTVSPVGGVGMTPRAQAEPAMNSWLAEVLPLLEEIACKVSFHDTTTNTLTEDEVTLHDLGVQPTDLLQLVHDDDEQAMSELDDRIVRFVVTTRSPRPDVPVTIRYMEKTTAHFFSVFELMPLMRHLRRLTQLSRPLKPSDLALTDEATSGEDAAVFIDKQRLVLVRSAMQTLRTELDNFVSNIDGPVGPLADPDNRRGELIDNANTYVEDLVSFLARAAAFAIPQTGWGFAYDFRQRVFRAILEKCAELVTRWNERLVEFDGLMLAYDNLPGTATDQEKFDLLLRAERLVSTTATSPLPPSPDAFKADLQDPQTGKRAAFAAKLDEFDAVKDTTLTSVTQLLSDVKGLLPITGFDFIDFSFTEQEDEMVRFAEDAVRVAKIIVAEMDRRLVSSQALFEQHDDAAEAAARVDALEGAAKALLGDDFLIVPEFSLGAAHGDELEKALDASQSGALFDYLENTMQIDFPVDTWLYGVARVREKMHAWEQVVMLTGAFGTNEPVLTALQLPFLPNDHWLALEFPPEAKPGTDRLLYTAHFASTFQKASRQCGLFVDEWTEVIPSNDATTGITFHYDRPNCEPPQTMLLVTPTDFRGAWQWEDLVDALNETLDLAKRRAVEPVHVDRSAYARFLPATIMAVTMRQLTISADLALNNDLRLS